MAAVTDAYATKADYKSVTSKTTTADDALIDEALIAVSRYIDRKTGRFFTKDAAVVARDYYGPHHGPVYPEAENPWKFAKGGRLLHIADLAAAPEIIQTDDNGDGTLETTPWAASDYQLMPLNADKGAEARPWTTLFVPEWSTKMGWPAGRLIRITAVWGWPAVPKAVKHATIQLAGILLLESPRATSRIAEGFDGAIETSREGQRIVRELLTHYGKATV